MQPFDHIPVLDSFGAWVSWIPRSGKGSVPAFDDAILFENSRSQSVCWINPKWLQQSDPAPNRLVPLLNADGRILQWIPQPDLVAPPPLKNTLPIRSRRYRYVTAWLHELPYDSTCGALVAYDS